MASDLAVLIFVRRQEHHRPPFANLHRENAANDKGRSLLAFLRRLRVKQERQIPVNPQP